MDSPSRRDFLKTAGIAVAGAAVFAEPVVAKSTPLPASSYPFDLGIASYTFRAFSLDQTIAMTRRLGLTHMTLKDMHLPLTATPGQIAEARKKITDAGLTLASCGVVYMKTEDELKKGFAYAQAVGIRMLVGVPDKSLLSLAERLVRETDIILAIHNHGPTDERFPSPESAYVLLKDMDRRMGLCVDVGHTRRLGLDPAGEIERFADRVFDVHVKDVTSADAKGTTVE
ncbi:MAG: sugar phosphate isomerase/epimerase, partial [Bacteroidetes bacterium]|nr:sugar phosphate isomerase/epimerase [Bacteroidota bacterium]